MRRTTLFLVLAILVLSLSGCGWWKDLWSGRKPIRNQAEVLYQAGVSAYQEGRYKRAVDHFTRVRELFPLHELALMAEIGVADAHFSDGQYIEAELAYTDFLMLHPPTRTYPTPCTRSVCAISIRCRPSTGPDRSLKTVKEFERLIARFPSSKFAFLAEKKLRECRQRLAEHEFYVGEFYFKREQYKAAIDRFEYLAKTYPSLGFDYQTTRYLEESRSAFRSMRKRRPEKRPERRKRPPRKSDLIGKPGAAGRETCCVRFSPGLVPFLRGSPRHSGPGRRAGRPDGSGRRGEKGFGSGRRLSGGRTGVPHGG